MDTDWADSQASLFDVLEPGLRRGDCWIPVKGYHWLPPPDVYHQLLLDSVYRRNETQYFDGFQSKHIMNPDCCAIDWTHQPLACFNHCQASTGGKVIFAHIKEWRRAKHGKEKLGVQDLFFAKESGMVRRQLCD